MTQVSDHWGNTYIDDTYVVDDAKEQKFQGYCTNVFFHERIKFIKENHTQPFFAYIAPNAPHEPLNVEKYYRDIYADEDIPERRRRYYGMISNIDDNFKKLLNVLKGLNIDMNSVVIFTTDNGTYSGCDQDENQFVVSGYNSGMRGSKDLHMKVDIESLFFFDLACLTTEA